MNYILLSRLIYSVPFLIYSCLNYQQLINKPETIPYMFFWFIIFLSSTFFYGISKKVLPLSLIHFVFIAEFFLYTMLSIDTGNYTFLLFTLLSSFYTIEALRNDGFHIFLHLAIFSFSLFFLNRYYGILPSDFSINLSTTLILLSPIVCRGILSSIESKDVILREVTKNKHVYIPMENLEKTNKLQKIIKSFMTQNQNLEKDKKNLSKEYQEIKKKFDKIYNSSQESQQINKKIVEQYFQLIRAVRFRLDKSFEENIHNILHNFREITEAKYSCMFIVKESEDNDVKITLIESAVAQGYNIDDDMFTHNECFSTKLMDTINNLTSNVMSKPEELVGLEPLKHIIITPISNNKQMKGVLVQAFDNAYVDNVHNYNLALLISYHLYTAIENINLYKQVKDDSNTDGLTQVYNKKYLLDNIQQMFNNIYNYEDNLACVFLDIDYFKQINDSFGHEKGDEILKTITNIIKQHIRSSDNIFRYGGDEFVILLSSVTNDKLFDFCKEVNQSLSLLKDKIIIDNEQRNISVSMGAKLFYPRENNVVNGRELIDLADKALYVSKKTGKGKLYIADNK